jgi:hypothetical protein
VKADDSFETLRADRIIATLDKLHARIVARFPEAGLGRVCGELTQTARVLAKDAARLSRPSWGWRVGVTALIALGLTAQVFAGVRFFHVQGGFGADAGDLLQGLEAAVNLMILFGGAVWFLLTLEERFKRRRVLTALYRLRSAAHVIDMHQLTKDPTIVLDAHKTAASPERTMSRFELTRYLDYCAEMLALLGKLAALYADGMRDSVVIDAVNDIENLTTGLGRKIWQKITIISALEEGGS